MLRRCALVLGSVVVLCGKGATPASADFQYVAGQQDRSGPTDGVCPGIGILGSAGYYRNEAGRNPRSNEPFFLEIRLTYFESFDCAAAFTGIRLTLPAGLAMDQSQGRVVCQRWAVEAGAPDQRITGSCPLTPANLGGGTYDLDPVSSPAFPDQTFSGRRYWFQGYDNARTYRFLRLLVPVSAPAALNAAPAVFEMKRFDAVTPWTASVPVTTTGTAQPGNGGAFVAPDVNVHNGVGDVALSPIGAQIPFTVKKGSTGYGISELTSVGATPGAAFAVCGEGATSETAFGADESFTWIMGDFGDPFGVSPACDLRPQTQYTTELCAAGRNPTGNVLVADCETTTYTTPPTDTSVQVTESATSSSAVTFTPVLRGAWPAGIIQLRLKRPASAETTLASTPLLRSKGQIVVTALTQTLTDLAAWQVHEVRACYVISGPTLTMCGPTQRVLPGRLEAAAPTATSSGATFAAVTYRTPTPAWTLQLRVQRAADAGTVVPASLPVVASTAVPSSGATSTATAPPLVASGLSPSTRYAWAVCADVGGDATPEECTPGASFTTAPPPPPPAPPAPPAPPPPGETTITTPATSPPAAETAAPPATGSPSTGTRDTTKPTVALRVRGAVRRGRKVTLLVRAADAGGLARVTIKAGSRPTVTRSSVVLRLPRKAARIRIVVTATDRAGNRTTLSRVLVVR